MRLFATLLFFLFVAFTNVRAQQQLDSLQTLFINVAQPDSVRFEAGLVLAKRQMAISMDSSRATGKQVLVFAEKANNKQWQADAHKWIGITHAQQGQFEKAHEFFFNNYELVKELGDIRAEGIILGNIGTVFYELGNYPTAQEYLLKSLKIAEEIGDKPTISRAYNNLGNVNNDNKHYQTAIDYYTKSLAIKEKMGLKESLPLVHNNIGLIHSELEDHARAIKSFTECIALSQEVNNISSEARCLSNLGREFAKTNRPDEALEYLNRAVQLKTQINDIDGLASVLAYRGATQIGLGNYTKARQDCQKSFDIAAQFGHSNLEVSSCACLAKAYQGLGNFEKALQFEQRHTTLRDSLFNRERTQELTRAELNYEFEKKQLADSINFHKKQTEQKVAYERRLNKQNSRFYWLLITSLGVIGFLTFLYYKHRQRLKLKKVENQLLNTEIEYKKKDLTTMAVNISTNQEWAESLGERLNSIKASTGRKRQKELELLEEEIKNKIWVNKDSDDFYQKVDELSSSFYARLNDKFEGLTKTEVRLCSFIKLNLNTKQIATLQNINPSSVKMSRNRLRKKLNLAPEDDLSAFLQTF